MASVGRNEPCPCGSGKKYEHCCATVKVASPTPTPAPSSWHAIDREVVQDMATFATTLRDFAPVDAFPYDPRPEDLQLLSAWMVYEYAFGRRKRVVDLYLEQRRDELDPRAREWLEKNRVSWLGAWQVESVDPGRGMTLVDGLTLERREVREVEASKHLTAGHFILARIVTIDGESLLVGNHPESLPAASGAEFVEEVRHAFRIRKKSVDPARLRAVSAAETLIEIWSELLDELHEPPALENTDGDPFLWTRDHFAFPTKQSARVVAALSAIPTAHTQREGKTTTIALSRVGNAMHSDWESTIVGFVSITDGKLRVESNSTRRADQLRAMVTLALAEAGLADVVRHRARDHQDPTAGAVLEAPRAAAPKSPDTVALMRQVKERHYRAWLDESIPALGGKTPREIAKAAKQLDALLKEMEQMEKSAPEAERFDFDWIRRELER